MSIKITVHFQTPDCALLAFVPKVNHKYNGQADD